MLLTFLSVNGNMLCNQSSKRYRTVLFCGTVFGTVLCDSNFFSVSQTINCDQSLERATEQYCTRVLFVSRHTLALTFSFVV